MRKVIRLLTALAIFSFLLSALEMGNIIPQVQAQSILNPWHPLSPFHPARQIWRGRDNTPNVKELIRLTEIHTGTPGSIRNGADFDYKIEIRRVGSSGCSTQIYRTIYSKVVPSGMTWEVEELKKSDRIVFLLETDNGFQPLTFIDIE